MVYSSASRVGDAVEGTLGRRWSTPGASAIVYQALRPDGKLQMEFRVLGSGPAVPEARSPALDVRKTVTVLFIDIVDSSRLSLALDPEALRNLLARYFDELSTVIRRHGGVVETYIGDAIMAVFGVPILHEDDAVRAVRAAVEMRDTLAILNREFEAGWGVRLANRIGVNTGEVIAGAQGHLSIAG
ncbi:MAG TPA: adenylate/guanylate cyclase domain-containing protein, partial [Nitrospiraceae bacterium]|nr:adenylate/guanylate cyclase domain-containing protein [Nitrospiraceae bacterium]